MPSPKLKSVSLIQGVMHRGGMAKQIACDYGDQLELTDVGVRVIPNTTSKRAPFVIPFSNVTCFVEIDTALEMIKQQAAEEKVKVDAVATKARAAKPVLKGVIKFVKNADGVIEEVET